MICWNFPLNNDGREDGLNDPGIETFKDNPLGSLAREIPQNSIDAADKDCGKPVEVHFELLELPITKFPDSKRFKSTLKACETYWRHIAAAKKFFRAAQQVMDEKKIRLLKVSDYNTTGLLGSIDDRTSDWFKLTKAVGASDKAGNAGGSFGIGKHAPFACSELRTVFYATKDKTGKFAFQGVSKLVTHAIGGKTTQGTGYFGEKVRNQPITKLSEVDPIFRRKEVGTDVFIVGFPKLSNWVDEVAKALIDSFFVAIYEGRLVARVGKTLINQASLGDLISKYGKADSTFMAAAYYGALTSEEAHTFGMDDFEGLGKVELRVLANKTFPKKVAMVRSGMKIYDKGHFQTPVRFAGVFLAKGNDLNAFLRSLEPPMHDHWEANRAEDVAAARTIVRKLYGWMNDAIKSLSAAGDVEELDAEGMSQYLPDDLDEAPTTADASSEGEKGAPSAEVPVQIRVYERLAAAGSGSTEPRNEGDEAAAAGGGGDAGGKGDGEDGNGGGGGLEGSADKDEGSKSTPSHSGVRGPASRPIPLKDVRIYCAKPSDGLYRLLFEPTAEGDGYLSLRVVGEVGEEIAPIKSVLLPGESGSKPALGPGRIGPIKFAAGKRLQVDVVLEDSLRCALGVAAYAD